MQGSARAATTSSMRKVCAMTPIPSAVALLHQYVSLAVLKIGGVHHGLPASCDAGAQGDWVLPWGSNGPQPSGYHSPAALERHSPMGTKATTSLDMVLRNL